MRGQLILIEGLDRSGKSTQLVKLQESIKDSSVVKFPDRSTPIGKIINDYLTNEDFKLPDQSIHLLFSANRWEVIQDLIDKLNNGHTIILDRYIYSGISYSLSKLQLSQTNNEMADVDWLYSPDKGLPKPDITLFLSLDLDQINSRAEFGDERYEKTEFQKIVKSNFLNILPKEGVEILNVNDKSIEQVQAMIWEIIEKGDYNKLTNNPISYFT